MRRAALTCKRQAPLAWKPLPKNDPPIQRMSDFQNTPPQSAAGPSFDPPMSAEEREAAAAANEADAAARLDSTLAEGTEATLRQLLAALERHKVIEVNPAAGARFDPTNQQAISMVPADQEANTIVSVLQKGYTIADRVLRPALVTVTAPK